MGAPSPHSPRVTAPSLQPRPLLACASCALDPPDRAMVPPDYVRAIIDRADIGGNLCAVTPHLSDLSGLAATPARVLWRHWPVLVSLAAAGLVGRVVVVNAAAYLAGVNTVAGFAVLLLAPLTVLATVALMLRAVRSSLPVAAELPAAVLPRLGSLVAPFVVFYLAFGLAADDYRHYTDHLFGGRGADLVRVEASGTTLILLGVAVLAYSLRFALTGFGRPRLVGPAAYLETVWITVGLLYVVRPYALAVWGWV